MAPAASARDAAPQEGELRAQVWPAGAEIKPMALNAAALHGSPRNGAARPPLPDQRMPAALDVSNLLLLPMLLAWLLAPLAVFVAMELFARVGAAAPAQAMRWRAAAALGLGTGIWSVHVTAVSALPLPISIGYHPAVALAAWALAVLASFTGLMLADGRVGYRDAPWRALAAAAVLGVGVLAVQAVALSAAGFRPGLPWRLDKLLPALVLAVAGSGLAIALVARVRPRAAHWRSLRDGSVALFWGASLTLAEFMVLSAVGLATQTASAHVLHLSSDALTLLASVGSFVLLLALLLLSRIEARLRDSLVKTREELAQHSLRDGLTKLPNRLRFEGTLGQAAQLADQRRGRLALLFVNIDGLKHVNHAAGHRGGDRFLCEIATRLRGAARPHMVARVGGDEFVLLMPDNPRKADAADLARRLVELVGEPCSLNGHEFVASCSIGIAMYPQDGALSALISHAEMAMRECKGSGGATYSFFEARMVSGAREQAELLRDLRQAVARGQLELVYQPKVHAPSGEITGAEALVRWNHPKRGLVSPAVFIPIAERFGVIKAIGDWVIDEACRQARIWRDKGLRMRVAINLSPHQLRDPELGRRIGAALKRHQINPKLLTCEITESVAMEDSQSTQKFFAVLAKVGVHISIDDFGTGYSSLSYLRKLPAEELKIDRSFICDLETSSDARAVVDAVVKLGQALNLKVVAEGVETEAQNQILRSLGCHQLQGYLFAKPMSPEALALWAINDVGPRSILFRASLFQATAQVSIH
jgi:diguanylate cyclase (GGDEF)-like protein